MWNSWRLVCVVFPGAENPTMMTTTDTSYLEQMVEALSLAENSPIAGRNPRVGCVLLDDSGSAVASGYHRGEGTPHAEVEALQDAASKGIDPAGLTAVVTLEPCNHHGSTGPCTEALISAGISRVVFGAEDPGKESGGGALTLQHAGLQVVPGVLAEQAEELNRHWFFAMRTGRPFVTAKWAQSLDGRSAATDGSSQWITGPESRARVHKQRAEHGVIMVGTETALVDNPSLTAREPDGALSDHQPHAVVVGKRELPTDAAVRSHPGGFSQKSSHRPADVLGELFAEGYRSVYLEGGKTLMSAFVRENLVDEFHIGMGPLLLGGPQSAIDDIGVESIALGKSLIISQVDRLGDDLWVVAVPQREG